MTVVCIGAKSKAKSYEDWWEGGFAKLGMKIMVSKRLALKRSHIFYNRTIGKMARRHLSN